VGAPKPFGMALSPDGNNLATIKSGIGPFSITLINVIKGPNPTTTLIPVNATFLGIVFSPDSSRFYASGGQNGNVWVGDRSRILIVNRGFAGLSTSRFMRVPNPVLFFREQTAHYAVKA
jgi:hypothetical protein